MKKKVPWVKWFPSDYLAGIIGLNYAEIAAYNVVLNMIYDNSGPIKDDPKRLAHRIMMRPSMMEECLQALVAQGKILRSDGVISNPRAEKEIETREKIVKKLRVNAKTARDILAGKVNRNNGHIVSTKANDEAKAIAVEARSQKPEPERKKEGAIAPPPGLARRRASRMDPHRKMSESNLLYARSRGLSKREAENLWEKYIRYYRALPDSHRMSKSADWDAVWEQWVLREAQQLNRDPLVETNGHDRSRVPQDFTRDEWVRIVEVWRMTSNWPPNFGPEPGRPGCIAPGDVVNHS